jgi:hypothetical protein
MTNLSHGNIFCRSFASKSAKRGIEGRAMRDDRHEVPVCGPAGVSHDRILMVQFG